MSMEKNIFKIVNNVINIIQKDPYYFTEINDYNLEYKDIDQLWDYFKSTSDDYHDKFKSQEEIIISDELKEIFQKNNIFKTIFSLHILNDKPHIVTFYLNNNENIFILYKNNFSELPSKFVSLTMPNPIEEDIKNQNNLKICCYFED
jgi:hypothetical protein